jgi:sigma-E factor negative regulatory protein RseA
MTEDIKQQLSALIDGELDAGSQRFLLRRLQHDQELAGSWERWHLLRDSLQRQRVAPLKGDFAAGIAAALRNEARPAAGRGGPLLRWAGGFAVAASVALAAILALPGPADPGADGQPAIASEVVSSGLSERDLRPDLAPVTRSVAVTQGRPLAPALQVDPRLEAYLLRHNAVLLQSGHDSFLPFLHVVTPARPWSMLPEPAALETPDSAR